MLKLVVTLAVGASLLLASAVWAGTAIQTKLNQLETFTGLDSGAVRLVP